MQLTIFGATGRVGREVTARVLAKNYQVTAFVHHSNPLTPHANLTVIKGDSRQQTDVARALKGSQAVISCLSTFKTKDEAIVSNSMKVIIPAMEAQGIKRIISLTGSGALWDHDRPTVFDRIVHRLLKLVADKILSDGEEHVRLLSASNLDWTVIRSPVITNRGAPGYRLSDRLPAPWRTIPRAAVTACLVDQLSDLKHLRTSPIVRRP